jgi:hypothetical protein
MINHMLVSEQVQDAGMSVLVVSSATIVYATGFVAEFIMLTSMLYMFALTVPEAAANKIQLHRKLSEPVCEELLEHKLQRRSQGSFGLHNFHAFERASLPEEVLMHRPAVLDNGFSYKQQIARKMYPAQFKCRPIQEE